MCVHVFGGTSSPGCCNYSLQKTAIDNEVRHGEEASQTLLHNSYVDDLLKSVETTELQSWPKYMRQTLVLVRNSTLQEKLNFNF